MILIELFSKRRWRLFTFFKRRKMSEWCTKSLVNFSRKSQALFQSLVLLQNFLPFFNYIPKRLKDIDSDISFTPYFVFHERDKHVVNDSFNLPAFHVNFVSRGWVLKFVSTVYSVFDFIGKCFRLYETGLSTVSTAHACSIIILMNICEHKDLTPKQKITLDELPFQRECLYLHVHLLSFTGDLYINVFLNMSFKCRVTKFCKLVTRFCRPVTKLI